MLASSSSGNCTFIATDRTRILVDVGLSKRDIIARLAAIDETFENLHAVLVTHEHSDHVCGLVPVAKQLNVPIYITRLTAPAIPWGEYAPKLDCFQAGTTFAVGDIDIDSFTVPHDAIDPVGFCFEAQGVRIGIVTDLGYIPESVKYHLRRTDLLMLEANHDLDMLKVGPYPWSVKQRVMSRVGHLSNLGMSDYLMQDLGASTANLILGHLSEHNNHPEIVRLIASQALEERGLPTRLSIARQHQPSEVFQY